MSVNQAAQQLLEIIKDKPKCDEEESLLKEDSPTIALARIGSDDQLIKSCTLNELLNVDMGLPLHSLVIPGKLHPLELDMIELFSNK